MTTNKEWNEASRLDRHLIRNPRATITDIVSHMKWDPQKTARIIQILIDHNNIKFPGFDKTIPKLIGGKHNKTKVTEIIRKFIIEYMETNKGQSPTVREIGEGIGMLRTTTNNYIYDMLASGILNKTPQKQRCLYVVNHTIDKRTVIG